MNRTTANGPAQAPAVEAQAEPGLLDRVVDATYHARQFTLPEVQFMAQAASKSGLFGLTESQAFVLMMIAESKGLHPIEAIQRYHVINNKPSKRAEAILAEMMSMGWDVKWQTKSDNVTEQAALFTHPRKRPEGERIGFTMEQADRAELLTGPNKGTWKKYPSNMLRARTISDACRMLEPGIIVGIYSSEEVSDFDDRPSPRPLPADAPASRVEPVATTAEAPAAPAPDGFWTWLQRRVDEVNNDWAAMCVKEKKPHEILVKHVNEALNGVITMWIEKDLVQPDQVKGAKKDTRSTAKMREMVDAFDDEDEHATRADFEAYFDNKWAREATALGVNLDAQPPEEALSNA